MKMTWTLFVMSFCYIVFVGPIFLVSVLDITHEANLFCFILYWFQVKTIQECPFLHSLYLLQYATNFVIYAGRSEQYRRAYTQYLRTTLPWLWRGGTEGRGRAGAGRGAGQRAVFIINPVIRRAHSDSELAQPRPHSSLK